MIICVHFPPSGLRLAFQVSVDEYSAIQTKGVFPIYSIVVRLEDGKVKELVWDNGCYECSSNCYTETTSSGKTQSNCLNSQACQVNATGAYSCDPKIYVSFIGTDKDGIHLTSSGMRISRFRQFSFGDMYNSAKNTYDSVSASIEKNWDTYINDNKNQYQNTTSRFRVLYSYFDNYLVKPITEIFNKK